MMIRESLVDTSCPHFKTRLPGHDRILAIQPSEPSAVENSFPDWFYRLITDSSKPLCRLFPGSWKSFKTNFRQLKIVSTLKIRFRLIPDSWKSCSDWFPAVENPQNLFTSKTCLEPPAVDAGDQDADGGKVRAKAKGRYMRGWKWRSKNRYGWSNRSMGEAIESSIFFFNEREHLSFE